MELNEVKLPEGDYYTLALNKEVVVQIKREREGYVVDLLDKKSNLINSLTIWNDDFEL